MVLDHLMALSRPRWYIIGVPIMSARYRRCRSPSRDVCAEIRIFAGERDHNGREDNARFWYAASTNLRATQRQPKSPC